MTTLLFKLEKAGICCLNHLEARQSANGYILAWLDCPKCSEESFCLKVASLVENEINLRNSVEAITNKV